MLCRLVCTFLGSAGPSRPRDTLGTSLCSIASLGRSGEEGMIVNTYIPEQKAAFMWNLW